MIRTLTGKNSFALQAALDKLVDGVMTEAGEFGIERFDASEAVADTLLQAVQSLPFLASKKLVIITNIQANGALMERLGELVERTAENVDVALVEPALDKRKATYKTLQKLTELTEFTEPKPQDLPAWAVDYAKEQGAVLSRSDASFLVERVGANQQLLAREIEKLSLYAQEIDKRTIELLTDQSVQSTIFSLLDAAFAGNSKKAVKLYREQRRARVEPQYIIAMLTWQLQALAAAVFAEPQTEATLVAGGQSPFTARKSLALARRVSKPAVRKMIVSLSELDAQIKTSADPDAGLELYLLSL